MKKFTIKIETLKTTKYCIFTKTFLNDQCPICFDNILPETRAKVGCKHSFCINCIKEYIIFSEEKKELKCPCCRKNITNMKLLNKPEMINIKNLVNDPQPHNMIDRRSESRFSEIRLYQRRQESFIIIRPSEVRI
jgi:ribosomal protein S27E